MALTYYTVLMKSAEFVHLHTHSQYSLLDGACKLDDVIAIAKERKMPALAITDHGNMFGAVEFYQKALKAGIKPIIGIEAYVSAGPMTVKKPHEKYPDGGFHLVLLAKNQVGYQNLIKIASAGYLEGFYHRPRVDKDYLRAHSEGLIATSACPQGEVNWNLLRGYYDDALKAANTYSEIFGPDNFFLEMQDHGLDIEQKLIPEIAKLHSETKLPLVCSNDCHYLRQEDAKAHDALLCIQTGKLVSDTKRMNYDTDQIFFKSPKEMIELFGEFPEAAENTLRIAEACNVEFEFGKLYLPKFPIPKPYVDADEYLRELTTRGAEERYGGKIDDEANVAVKERLDYELSVIKRLGYAGYFLITKDFIDHAREIGVRVGPGRGSAAGSIVSYTLKITSIDPLKYSLLFERFLNPERVSMPDIDIDFADRGREKIIEYVIEKYGSDNVTQIITFGTMAARGVLRDVGRVLSIPYSEVDKIAKMVPFATDMTLARALKENPDIQKLADTDERVATLLDYGQRLEGLTRHASTHAAGVVIAPSALTNYVPLFKGSKDEVTTQFDMKCVEKIGLLKMDFLGLRTLTVIDDALAMIESGHGKKVDIDSVPLDDEKVFKLFGAGLTIGVFQFESSGMREYLRKLKPESLDDLMSMNALYRPGSLDARIGNKNMVDVYIDRKKDAKNFKYDHPILEDVLKNTYGVIVFQEQVLQIANRLAGFSMGKADLLRKAMGKKDANLMAEQKKEFLIGCEEKKINKKIAATVFDQIEKFARYGFNKAHSVCYAYVAYQTAFLKAHYPHEFLAACMTSEIDSSDRINILLEECRQLKIKALPPDVNESQLEFTVVDGNIRFGLLAIKNVGEAAVNAIISARDSEGKFASLADFVSRTPTKSLNRRTLESLIHAGALDNLPGNRQQKVTSVERMLEFGARVQQQSASHDLFVDSSGATQRAEPEFANIEEYPTTTLLSQEKETLGFYVSGHPLDRYRIMIAALISAKISDLGDFADGTEVKVMGIFTTIKTTADKRGKLMAFSTLEDFSGSTELICFSDCYEKHKETIVAGKMALATGRGSTREGQAAKILANEVVPLEKVMERFDCQLVIKVNQEFADPDKVESALKILEEAGNSALTAPQKPLLISYRFNGSEAIIRSKKYRVNPENELMQKLGKALGEDEVYLIPNTAGR